MHLRNAQEHRTRIISQVLCSLVAGHERRIKLLVLNQWNRRTIAIKHQNYTHSLKLQILSRLLQHITVSQDLRSLSARFCYWKYETVTFCVWI